MIPTGPWTPTGAKRRPGRVKGASRYRGENEVNYVNGSLGIRI